MQTPIDASETRNEGSFCIEALPLSPISAEAFFCIQAHCCRDPGLGMSWERHPPASSCSSFAWKPVSKVS